MLESFGEAHPMEATMDVSGKTIPMLVDERAGDEGLALMFPDQVADWSEYQALTMVAAARFCALGVGPGDKVGLLQHGDIDMITLMIGAMRLGAVAVPVNARYKSTELRYLVEHADLKVLMVGEDFVDVVLEAIPALSTTESTDLDLGEAPALEHVVGPDAGLPGFVSRAEFDLGSESVTADEIADMQSTTTADDVCLLLYTSGTTASPKGCMHSHSTMLHEAFSLGVDRLRLTADDVFWSPLPLFHVGGIDTLLSSLVAGCKFCHVGLFEPGLALRQLTEQRCTVAFPAFETIWLAVLDHADFEEADLSALRIVVNVGVPERLRSMQERLPHAVQVSAVGGTEAAGFLSIGVIEDSLDERVETGGHIVAGMEAKLIDPETGKDLPPGNTGELLFRGVSRFLGYYRDPEVTAACIDEDGWFHSGDVIRQDGDGRITFVSRLKDMLKVGGENVAAAEIESYLASHPSVHIVQVVAAPDARYDEVAAAFVQLKPGVSATEAELIDYCRGQIATFKVPRYVRFVDEWPMSGTKVQKYRLREDIAKELADAGILEAPRIEST
ncbi:MAG: AMP-binding protein [Acidimicrobiales bacterium]